MKGTTILKAYVRAANRAEFWRQEWGRSWRRRGPLGADPTLYPRYARYRVLADKCYRRLARRLGQEPSR